MDMSLSNLREIADTGADPVRPAPAASRRHPGARSVHRGCIVERIGADRLAEIAEDWKDLSARSVEPNALHAAAFATAAITRLADAEGFEAAALWRPGPQGDTLIGLVPVRQEGVRQGRPLGATRVLSHNFGPLGTPVLDARHGLLACEAFLDWARRRLQARFLLVPFLTQTGPAAAMLRNAMVRGGLRHAVLNPFRRGLAVKGAGRYTDETLTKKKRHDMMRLARRLGEKGALTQETATSPDEVAVALDAFLELEAAGWKGRGGTAAVQRADRRAFFEAGVNGMAADGHARVQLMKLDGRTIAAGVLVLDRPRAYFLKIAYDEAYAAYSPGVQLALRVIDEVLEDPAVTSIDSLADPDHPMIDHIMRERLEIADWLVDLTPGGSPAMALAVASEKGLRKARILVRTLLHATRERVATLRESALRLRGRSEH